MTSSIADRLVAYKVAIIGYSIFVAGVALILLPYVWNPRPEFQTILQVLGAALVPSGVISLITEHFLRRDLMNQMSSLFDNFLLEHLEELYRTSQSIATLHDANPTAAVSSAIADAQREVILFNGWIPDFEGIQRGLRAAIQRQVSVRILLLNPDSHLSAFRAYEIGLPNPETQRYYTRIDLDNMVRFIEEAGGRSCVSIRLFDELLVAPVYATDSEMFAGWFYKARRAVAGPVVRVGGPSTPLYAAMKDSFERVWQNGSTVEVYPVSNV